MSSQQAPAPRISPGGRRDIGLVATGITRVLGMATGSSPPNLFTTLARNRKLFRPWLRFAASLMPAGSLTRRETELVILRVAAHMDCTYEAEHHERLAREVGISDDEIARVRQFGVADSWDDATAVLLTAVDQLGDDGNIADATWTCLARTHTESQLIELCLLVGHCEMLAKTINTLRIEPDGPPTKSVPAIIRRIEGRMSRST